MYKDATEIVIDKN